MAAKQAKGVKSAKSKGGKDAKNRGKSGSAPVVTVASHPRAASHIGQAKGWGGLGAFFVVGYLSLHSGAVPADAAVRALIAGVLGYVVAWGLTVGVWRHLAIAEIRAAHRAAHRAATEAAIVAAAQEHEAAARR